MPTQTEAVVTMFRKTKRCTVYAYGTPRSSYRQDQVLYVERAEDEYGASSMSEPFCVLYKEDWKRGEAVDANDSGWG